MRHSLTLVPIGLAGIGLVGITIYRLATPVSDDLKKNLSYAELILSLVTSSMVLLFMGGLFMTGVAFRVMNLSFVAFLLVGSLLNPFVLTVIRLLTQDKINDTLASSAVIASTGGVLLYTLAMFTGRRTRTR